MTPRLENHQIPKTIGGEGEGINFITIRLTSLGERGVCRNNRFQKFIYELNLTAQEPVCTHKQPQLML